MKASTQRVSTTRILRCRVGLLAAVQMLCTYHCHELSAGRFKSSQVTKRCPIGNTAKRGSDPGTSKRVVSGRGRVIRSQVASSQVIVTRFRMAQLRFLKWLARCETGRTRFRQIWRLSLAAGGKRIGYRAKKRRLKWHVNPKGRDSRNRGRGRLR